MFIHTGEVPMTDKQHIRLSIIIINWNGKKMLANCLASLSTFMNKAEVIVVDNGSADGSQEFIKQQYPSIKLIELPINSGVASARNLGMSHSKGEYILLLDNDTEVRDQSIEGMLNFMDSHQEAGMCSCKLIDGNGLEQDSAKKYPGIKEKVLNICNRGKYRYGYSESVRNDVFSPEYLIGACQLIRQAAYHATGQLDENIFYGPEDADYCLRMKQKGWSIYYIPTLSIIHLCQRLTNKRLFTRMSIIHVRALVYFYFKHKRFIV